MALNRLVPSILLTASLLAGCSAGETTPTPKTTVTTTVSPTIQPPSESVMQRLSRELGLSNLANQVVRNSIDFNNGTVVNHVIGLTDAAIDVPRLQRTQAFIGKILVTGNMINADVTQANGSHSLITERFVPNNPAERTYIFASASQISDIWQRDIHASLTVDFGHDTTSFIATDLGANKLLPQINEADIGLAVELCQSETDVQTSQPVDEATSGVLQEAFCNGLGRAIAAHQTGIDYASYFQAYSNGRITRNGHTTAQPTVGEKTYQAIPG